MAEIHPALRRNFGSDPSPTTVLFIDAGHILCSDLNWLSPEGNSLPVVGPPQPQIDALASTGYVARGVQLVAQRANKTEPLSRGQASWNRIIFEDGRYRSWHLAVEYPPGRNFGSYSTDPVASAAICSVESQDGFEWSVLERCPIEVPGQRALDGFTVFVDPVATEAERYKAVYTAWPPEAERPALWEKYQKIHPRYRDWRLQEGHLYCMYGATSPDGIQWPPIREPLMVHMSDTDTSIYYDSWLEKYVMYTRLYRQDRRWIGRAETDDFRHWNPVEPLIWPTLEDSVSDDIYTNGRTEYPGLPEYHLMFPMFYHRYTQSSEVRLFSSADGICWNQVPGGPVLSPGAPDEWDGEFITGGRGLVPLGNDRVGMMYSGTRFPHKYPRWPGVLEAPQVAWAWWPKGRLCAVVAEEEGEFFTAPLIPAGRELKLNVRTRRAGWVQVGVADCAGRAVTDCDPVFGDHPAQTVHWKGQADIGVKEGEPVILHFKLRAAELFGFEW